MGERRGRAVAPLAALLGGGRRVLPRQPQAGARLQLRGVAGLGRRRARAVRAVLDDRRRLPARDTGGAAAAARRRRQGPRDHGRVGGPPRRAGPALVRPRTKARPRQLEVRRARRVLLRAEPGAAARAAAGRRARPGRDHRPALGALVPVGRVLPGALGRAVRGPRAAGSAALPGVRRRGREGLVGGHAALLRARPRAAGAGRAGRARRLPAPRRGRRRPDRTPGLPALRRGRRGARRGAAHVPWHAARALLAARLRQPRGRDGVLALLAARAHPPHRRPAGALAADRLGPALRAGQRGRRRGLLPTRIGARRGDARQPLRPRRAARREQHAAPLLEGADRRADRDPLHRGAGRRRHRLGAGVRRDHRGQRDLPAALRRHLPRPGRELRELQGLHHAPDRAHRVRLVPLRVRRARRLPRIHDGAARGRERRSRRQRQRRRRPDHADGALLRPLPRTAR